MPSHHGSSGTSAGVSQGSHSRSYNPGAGGVVQHGPTKTKTKVQSKSASMDDAGINVKHSGVKKKRLIGGADTSKDVPYKGKPIIGPISLMGNLAAKQAYKNRQKYARKEGLYREYYIGNQYKTDPSKRVLKPNSPEGKEFLKDAGYNTRNQPQGGDGNQSGGGQRPCPDGRNPPCVGATSAEATKPATPSSDKPYHMGFDFQKPMNPATHRALPTSNIVYPYKKGGLSGGKRYGPPPKKGPNPHGKCPHRPDGIRGVGAVQPGRGVKFVGVK